MEDNIEICYTVSNIYMDIFVLCKQNIYYITMFLKFKFYMTIFQNIPENNNINMLFSENSGHPDKF